MRRANRKQAIAITTPPERQNHSRLQPFVCVVAFERAGVRRAHVPERCCTGDRSDRAGENRAFLTVEHLDPLPVGATPMAFKQGRDLAQAKADLDRALG